MRAMGREVVVLAMGDRIARLEREGRVEEAEAARIVRDGLWEVGGTFILPPPPDTEPHIQIATPWKGGE